MNRIQLPTFWRTFLVAWAAFCSSAGPGTWAATQYWDTGIAGGIQGTSTNVGWSTSSNAWSSISLGTTTPGTWTNGNDAVFNTGASSAPIATVTVFSVSANSLTFGPTVNGRVVFMPGSGALTNGAGGFFSTFDAAVVTFNNDIVLSATQTWTVGYTTTINGRVSGADALWTKAGDYTLTLTNGANSFSGGLVINNGTVTGSGGGTVLGTGPIEIGTVAPSNAGTFSIVNATLNVNAGAVNTTTTISNLTVTGGATLQLNNATANVTNTLNAAALARTGLGTLIVIPANSLGVREKIFFTGGTNLINGILAPWLVTSAGGGNFVSNGANGLTNATYTTSFGAANVVSNGVLTTLLADQQAYALKSVANINLNGNTLTIGDGTTAGMILSASITNGGAAASLAFGTAEALMYMISGNTGTIAVEVSGGGGLTKLGAGTLVISNAGLWSSDITINNGTVILSPTANLTYAHGITGLGNLQKSGSAMLTLTNDYTLGGGVTVTAGTLTLAGGSLTARNFTSSGGNTTLRISNEVVRTKAGIASIVGSGSSNNVLAVLADTVWDFSGGGFIVGSGAATGNVLTIDGGTVSNSDWNVGNAATAIGNRLILQNGASLIWTSAANRTSIGLGVGGGISNSITVMTGAVMSNASTMTFGGSFNTFTVGATGTVYSGGFFDIGGADNQAFVTGSSAVLRTGTAGVVLTGTRGLMVVSNGGSVFGGLGLAGNRNQVLVTGTGVVWNGSVSIGFIAGANNNTVIVESGGRINGNLVMGGANSSNNRLLIRDGGIFVDGNGGYIGRSTTGSSNIIHVTGTGSVFSNTAGQLTFGNGPNTGNGLIVESNATFYSAGAVMLGGDTQSRNDFLRIDSATFKSAGLTIGGFGIGGSYGTGPSSFNWMTVTNAQISTTSLIIGDRSATNTVDVSADTIWNLQGGAITVGSGTATGNVLTINSGVLTNGGAVTVGSATGGNGNRLTITNGAKLFATSVTAGGAASADNRVAVIDGALLEANTLVAGAGSGNTVSNRAATYQFTLASPVITPNGTGRIAITDGTISFRAINNADVTNNLGKGALSGIAFAGANTFQLNAASNNIAGQTYTFQEVAGNPSNYVNLAMVNGHTAYRGGNLTIGSTGTFLASNTVATISGTFTNNGFADIVDATVNFQSALDVAGTLTLRNGFVTGGSPKTIAGTLRGNGSVVGDATLTGDLSPGLSIGTLVFSNNLTLAGSYQAEFGDGGNDQLIVVGDLTLAGATLDLTEVGGLTGATYVIASYGDLFGTFSVTNGMPVGYTLDYSYGGNQIAIVVIPEPGSLGLVILGMLGLGIVHRYRRLRYRNGPGTADRECRTRMSRGNDEEPSATGPCSFHYHNHRRNAKPNG